MGRMGKKGSRKRWPTGYGDGTDVVTDPARGPAGDEAQSSRNGVENEPPSVEACKTQQKPVLRRKSSVTEIPGVYLADSCGTEGTRRTVSFGDQVGKDLEEVFEIDARKGVFQQIVDDICVECVNLCSKWKAFLLGRNRSQGMRTGQASNGTAEGSEAHQPLPTPRNTQ